MTTINDITKDKIKTRVPSKKFLENYDKIDFSKKLKPKVKHVKRST